MSKNKLISRTPSYYVRMRLWKNKPAMLGLVFIVIAHIIAILGYLIMPDHTPNANDGSALIKKKPPGFEALLLKVRKSQEIPQANFFERMYMGQESPYIIIPIKEYYLKDLKVYYVKYENETEIDSANLITITKPIYVGASDKLFPNKDEKNYYVKNDTLHYLDLKESLVKISKADLVSEFEKNNIEKRRYILGTDKAGRDILSRLLFGTRISLSIGLIAVLISVVLGVTLGALGGFFGGWLDNFIMWLMTVIWSVPSIMLVIAISLALQSKGIWVAFVAVGLTMWVEVARIVRGQIISIKEKLFVEAARALGIRSMRIIFMHILPNMMGPLIVIATANFASAIMVEAGLSFLGLGVQPPMPSWGMMVNEGFHAIGSREGSSLVLLPSLSISLTVLAFNLFGNGLRDAYDPKTAVKW